MALVRSTFPDGPQARHVARSLIEAGHAACVHVSRVHSTYRWKGKLEDASEMLLEARTTTDRADGVRKLLLAGHPYENPLVEVIEVRGVPDAYAAWAAGKRT